jgi:hypothetical protein
MFPEISYPQTILVALEVCTKNFNLVQALRDFYMDI